MEVAIIDNSKIDRELLAGMIETAFTEMGIPLIGVELYKNGTDFLSCFRKKHFDLLFLDIHIGTPNGIDVAQNIRRIDPAIKLIFFTASNDFASESYALGINYYLLKPCSLSSLKQAVNQIHLPDLEAKKTLTLPDGQNLLLYSILYTAFFNRRILIYRASEPPLQIRCSQSSFEALLHPYSNFISCNRGMIVNLNGVEKLESGRFVMKNGDFIPISRRRYAQVKKRYSNFLLEKAKRSPNQIFFY